MLRAAMGYERLMRRRVAARVAFGYQGTARTDRLLRSGCPAPVPTYLNEIYSSSEVFWSGRLSDQHLTIRGTRSLERDLHTRFQAARYNRELFRLPDQDIHCLRM